MSAQERPVQRIEKTQPDLRSQEKKQRKKRVLTQGTASVTQSIADALVVKNENVFLITRPDGMVPLGGQHGFGLYYNDCRFLSGYDLQIMDCDPNMLVSNASQGFRAVLELTNPDIQLGKDQRIAVGEIGITWERLLDAGECTLFDSIVFRNFGRTKVELPVSLRFEADFQDVFSIRGLLPDSVDRIEMRRLRVGEASVDLNFERSADEYCDVNVVNVEGELDVVVETEQAQEETERIGRFNKGGGKMRGACEE